MFEPSFVMSYVTMCSHYCTPPHTPWQLCCNASYRTPSCSLMQLCNTTIISPPCILCHHMVLNTYSALLFVPHWMYACHTHLHGSPPNQMPIVRLHAQNQDVISLGWRMLPHIENLTCSSKGVIWDAYSPLVLL